MPAETYDVLIAGAGMSGGAAAYALTAKGANVLVLDAGPVLDPARHRGSKSVYDLPYRGFNRPGRFPHITQASEFNANLWADEAQNPYTYPPEHPYYWVRVRLVGGRSLLWGRWSLRLSDYEFRGRDHDGFGDNWPLRYRDLEPYYNQADSLLRVSSRPENLPQLPDNVGARDNSPDSPALARFRAAADRMGITVTKPRRAGGAWASSVNLFLPRAAATGRLTLTPNAIAREVTVDKSTGRASGIRFVDRVSGRDYHARARVVVLAASTLESTRILLNSGIANSSGVLGRYLFDQFYVKGVVQAVVPRGLEAGGGGYVVRFRNLKERDKRFLRGYAYDFGSRGTPDARYYSVYGEALKQAVEANAGRGFSMTTMGEVVPLRENHVTIDKDKKDAWGIPVLHIRQSYGDNERAMARDSMETAEELCRNAGFEILAKHDRMVPPGESIHELGTCRMGDNPKASVVNQFQQAHDVKNLFVVDGSTFVSGGVQNPTLTMVALCLRSCEYLAGEMQRRNL